jgi:ribonuclease BN (tRNA processing enzyme)
VCGKCNGVGKQEQSSVWDALSNLPHEILNNPPVAGKRQKRGLFDFILHIDPVSWDFECCDASNTKIKVAQKPEDHSEGSTSNSLASSTSQKVPQRYIKVPEWTKVDGLSSFDLVTAPDQYEGTFDPGILIRAQHRSRLLNKYIPFAFPLTRAYEIVCTESPENDDNEEDGSCRKVSAFQLRSCTSVLLNRTGSWADSLNECQYHPFSFISRIECIESRCRKGILLEDDVFNANVIESLNRAYSGNSCDDNNEHIPTAEDSNEIEIDNASVGDNEAEDHIEFKLEGSSPPDGNDLDELAPHLLLLGTGCATPTPLRGSSSHGLFMPTSTKANSDDKLKNALVLTAIIETGEGTLTSLSRHMMARKGDQTASLKEQLRWVQLIWISHSHLDHYGDLPSVVEAIAEAKQGGSTTQPVIVIAPSKVLKFLRHMLRLQRSKPTTEQLYVGITHREFHSSPFASSVRSMLFEYALPSPHQHQHNHDLLSGHTTNHYTHINSYRPFKALRLAEVEHCEEAFALLLELWVPQNDDSQNSHSFFLCFSGDTRPSDNFVRQCRSYNPSHLQQNGTLPPPPPPHVSLLLHEATFLSDVNGQLSAAKKKHSTTAEALGKAHKRNPFLHDILQLKTVYTFSDIAERIEAEACLLTHFSQRYSHVSLQDAFNIGAEFNDNINSTVSKGKNCRSFSWGVGVDGLLIPLKTCAISLLYQLCQCIDRLVASVCKEQFCN